MGRGFWFHESGETTTRTRALSAPQLREHLSRASTMAFCSLEWEIMAEQ